MSTSLTKDSRVRRLPTGRDLANSSRFKQIDPLSDPRWVAFLQRHPSASIFHTPEWLRCLQSTYGYEPLVFTTSNPAEPLKDAVVFCRVKTWLVKPRLVSLPFSDHTEILLSDPEATGSLLAFLAKGTQDAKWASVELRSPIASGGISNWSSFGDGEQFILHNLDLEPGLETLFRRLNQDSTQRKIRKAAREGMKYEEGRSDEQLEKFFKLSVMTRRRKGLPPPPFKWFRNVLSSLGPMAKIRVATTSMGNLAGAIMTLSFKNNMVYKYGASDARFHNLGTMPFLLWKAIEDAKDSGATNFDLGRSELANEGLIHFKNHFGAKQSVLTHRIFPAHNWKPKSQTRNQKLAKRIFLLLPERALILSGRLIYPHIG